MNAIVETALALWGMTGASYRFVAARENTVYHISTPAGDFALRLHRKGYRTDAELWSELMWMAAVQAGGIAVPAPVPTQSGALLQVVEGVQVDMLTWLSGKPMGESGVPLETPDREGLFFAIGREMARLHKISDAWPLPAGFSRCAWDRNGLLGEKPVWGRFWENPGLSNEDQNLFSSLRLKANHDLANIEAELDYGLIHADLVRENVMIEGNCLQFIDFDDGGFGFRLFDLATTLVKTLPEPDYPQLREALLDGYRSVRPMDTASLDLFIVLRATTYVGWTIPRMAEPGTVARNERFIGAARSFAQAYLCTGVL